MVDFLDAGVRRWLESKFHISREVIIFKGTPCAHVSPSTLNLVGNLGGDVQTLDLSFAGLGGECDLRYLEGLTALQALVLDNCGLEDGVILPHLAGLKTLSLNKNNLKDLDALLGGLSRRLPSLRHLSFMGNPCNPHPCLPLGMPTERRKRRGGGTAAGQAYHSFRVHALSRLLPHCPSLLFLDDQEVTDAERREVVAAAEVARGRAGGSSEDYFSAGSDAGDLGWNSLWKWAVAIFPPQEEVSEDQDMEGEVEDEPSSRSHRIASRFLNQPPPPAANERKSVPIRMQTLSGSGDVGDATKDDADEVVELAEEAFEQTHDDVDDDVHVDHGEYVAEDLEEVVGEEEECGEGDVGGGGRAFIGRLKCRYKGRNSEGNRFILDKDL